MNQFNNDDIINDQKLLHLKELNRIFKEKWVELINMKNSFFEVHTKFSLWHTNLFKENIIELMSGKSNLDKTPTLGKRSSRTQSEEGFMSSVEQKVVNQRFSKDSVKTLKDWFLKNIEHPYPR